jgi:hypothetical protein
MFQIRLIRATLSALLTVGLGSWAAPTSAAPTRAILAPTGVKTNNAFTVEISNPVFAKGKLDVLALRVDISKGANNNNRVARRVSFAMSRNNTPVFSSDEQNAPYCIFGDQNNQCNALQAGDDFPKGGLIKIGAYAVKISVYSTASAPDWEGTVRFALDPGSVSAEKPPYGTGQGNGPLAQIVDKFYSAKGMRALRIEAKVFTDNKAPMRAEDVQFVRFMVTDLGRNGREYGTLYANFELNAPYCIFGEESNGKTCKTLRVGDRWPQSNRRKEDTGDRFEKENDPAIAQTQIEPGEYEITIFISTNQGTWSSSGEITLLP